MNKTTTRKEISKYSNIVLACEHRSAWREIECILRHGADLSKSPIAAMRCALLEDEMKRRGIAPLPL